METPFATVAQLEARWRSLTTDEEARAIALLSDASTYLALLLGKSGIDYADASDTLAAAIQMVTCNIVKRMMDVPDGPAMTQYSQGAIGYSESMSFANPSGDMYITKAERKMLGLRGSAIGSIRPLYATDGGGSYA